MSVHALLVQQPPLLQVRHNILVGVLHELAGEREVPDDGPLQIHLLHKGQSVLTARRQVFVTEGRRDVDYARALVQRNKVPYYDRGRKVLHRLQNRRVSR